MGYLEFIKHPQECVATGIGAFWVHFLGHKKNEQLSLLVLCGKGGIRTPGASQHGGFQDRCNRPLYHLSSALCRCSFSKAMQRYRYFLKHASLFPFFFKKSAKKLIFLRFSVISPSFLAISTTSHPVFTAFTVPQKIFIRYIERFSQKNTNFAANI